MAKPRTNADTIEYWAESICARQSAPYLQVNSIIVERDVVYSFGSHYPMGVIQRDSRGKVKRVILNSDYYPSQGFANTPGDQANVRMSARQYAADAGVPIKEMLLSAYKTNGKAQVRPRPDDPEPPADVRYEVPALFTATDPGPEPTDEHPEHCIAGERYGYSKFERVMKWSYELREWDLDGPDAELTEMHRYHKVNLDRDAQISRSQHVLAWIDAVLEGRELVWINTWVTHWTEYGTKSYDRVEDAKYEQCPHCAAFQNRHGHWRARMEGGYLPWSPGNPNRRIKGWQTFIELVMRYEPHDMPQTLDGSWDMQPGIEGWREARRQDAKRVTAARRARKEWEERNWFPLDNVPTKNGIPDLDADGFIKRKHVEQWKREERQRKRTRAAQEHELAIQRFCHSPEPAIFPGPRGRPLAAIFPRTSEAYAPSLVLVKGTIHNRDKEEILLTASQRGNRIQYVDGRTLTQAVAYIKND